MEKPASRLALPFLFLYFLIFAIPALRAGFAGDDPMNLQIYWARGFWRCLADCVDFFGSGYRPMAAMFYLPIYHFARMNPLPYRIGVMAIMAGSLYLTFLLIEEFVESKAAATLATVVMCSHYIMVGLYYNTSMIYDLMAYFFVAAMLLCYVRFRRGGRDLPAGRAAVIVLFYLAAIDSKEMAVAGAVWIIAWELICGRPWKLLTPAILAFITLIYAASRVAGPHALASEAGYKLDLTVHRFFLNNVLYAADLFHIESFHATWELIAVWLAVIAVAATLRRREAWWCAFAIFTSTLPTAFTVWPRNGGCLILPLFAWVLFLSILSTAILKSDDLRWRFATAAAVIWSILAIPPFKARSGDFMREHRLTTVALEQLRALPLRPPPRSRVIFVNDPFEYWDMLLISELYWNDHTIDVTLGKKLPQLPDLNSFDWVLTFEGESLRVVRTRAM